MTYTEPTPADEIDLLISKMTEIDLERLEDLIFGYEQCRRFREEHEGDRYGVAPIDCGGTDGSDHSYRFAKLARMGLAETRKRGLDWGQKPRKGTRGSNVYRPTATGFAVRQRIREKGVD